MDSHASQLSSKLHETAAELETRLQGEIAALSERYSEVESMVAQQNEEAEKQQTRALETMTSLLLEMNQLRSRNHSELNRQLNASNEAGTQAIHDLGRAYAASSASVTQQTQAFSRDLGQLVRGVEAVKEAAVGKENAQAKAWEQVIKDGSLQAKEKRDNVLGSCKQGTSAVNSKLSSGEKKTRTRSTNICLTTEPLFLYAATTVVQNFAEGHKTEASSAGAVVVRNVKVSEADFETASTVLKGRLDDLEAWRQIGEDRNESSGKEESDQVLAIADATENLFANEIKRDEPSGSTPQRRKFRYPQTWDRTKPHGTFQHVCPFTGFFRRSNLAIADEILSLFRSAAEAAANSLPTPVSPGDEASLADEDDDEAAVASDISDEDIQNATDVPLPPSRSESRASERSEVPPPSRPDSRLAVAAAANNAVSEQKRPVRADTGGSKIPSMALRSEGGTKLPLAKSAGPVRRAGTTSTVFAKDENSGQ